MIRTSAAQLIPSSSVAMSKASPKICLIGPPASYVSTSGGRVSAENKGAGAMDCRIRAVSVGDFHRTVPATMLSALAVARALPGTVVTQECHPSTATSNLDVTSSKTSSIRVGQPAGISEAAVALDEETGLPRSILYTRTARRIMSGHVLVPTLPRHS